MHLLRLSHLFLSIKKVFFCRFFPRSTKNTDFHRQTKSRSELIENPQKGVLWPYLKDVDVFRCPRGVPGHAATYSIVVAANGQHMKGTCMTGTAGVGGSLATPVGRRIGRTVLRLTRLTDIMSPGASQLAVFIDQGQTHSSGGFHALYRDPKWEEFSPPPIHHSDSTTLSMADGHAEYWKWRARETVAMPRVLLPAERNLFFEMLEWGRVRAADRRRHIRSAEIAKNNMGQAWIYAEGCAIAEKMLRLVILRKESIVLVRYARHTNIRIKWCALHTLPGESYIVQHNAALVGAVEYKLDTLKPGRLE